MSDKKTIIKNFQSMKPSIVFKQLDYSKLPKEVRDKMKGDLSGVSDDTLDLQFEQSTFKKWIETFADLYPAAFGIKEEAKVVSIAPVAKVEPVVKAEHIVVAEEKTIDTSELETKIKDLETRLSVVNKMILKQPLKKTELKIRVKTIEKMIAKFKEELKNKKASSKKKVVKKSLGGFLFGALGGFIAGQLVDLKLTRKKVRFDLGGTIHGDKKYKYSITYTTIFESENEENPYEDNNGFEVENEIEELQDILQEAVNKYGISSPTGSPIHAGISFESVTPKQDRDYFEKGIETYFTLHVKNVDGSDITLEETQLIADKLKEGRKLHWDEEEKNWWKDGGEIHSKDTDGTLVFKADTKGGKYSIEVREGASGNLMNYDIRDYTNGSLRGMSFISNKELLMHKLIDTILGSKKIDGINYIISHDDLGVKEYLPASEKIWDIYNSAEFREWFKKQNETLTEEQKQSLSDELKNKTIKYVRDNGYKENDSTIGSFFQLFRKERLIKDFYESKGMVMLKDGGDVQTQEWLSNMNQERINELKEQRAKIEKEMPEDYKETSGGSGRTKAQILADFDRHISERENKNFENGGGVGKKSYEITFEDVWSFATAKRNAELTDAQYSKAIKQMENKDVVVDKYNEKQGIHEQLRIKNIVPKYDKGGSIQSEINDLYSKSNFINDDFNWKMKLLEMLQDRSVEAYNIYQSLNEIQKEEVLQELFEADNDMGSDGDGELSTSKENLEILLEDAKNGNKYSNGGGVSEWKFNVGDKVMLTPLTFFSKKGFERYDLTKPVTIVGRKKVALNTDGEYRLDNTTVNNEYFIKVLDGEGGLPIVTAKENELTLVTEYSNGGGVDNDFAIAEQSVKMLNEIHREKDTEKRRILHSARFQFNKQNEIGLDNSNTISVKGKKVAVQYLDEADKNNLKKGKHVEFKIKKYTNGGGIGKAIENLHEKASSSTTPRGKNKIIIPEGDSVYTMSQKDRDRLDELQIKENEDRLTKSENDEYEELVKKYRKTKSYSNKGGVDLNKDKFSLTSINNDLVQMVIGEDWTAKEFKEHFLNKGYELKPDNSIVGFYFAKPDGQTFQLVPSFHKKGEIIKYKDGGSISFDNTPKVYIADLAAYNEGSLVGEWLDLSEFGSGEEVMEKISELLKQWSEEAGEEREEYSVHDMENFPKQMYSEGMGESSFQKVIDYWEAINGTDYPMEVVEEFASLTGEDVTDAVDKMKDAYYGKFDSVDDFAREYVDSVGGIEGVSNPEQYIDISETDKRIIASEEADNVVDGMSDDDILKQANLYDEYQEAEDSENEEEMDRILEEAKESVREEIESEWEKGLRNPYNFLVEEQGLYDSSSIMKANFIMFDYKKFGKDLEQDYYAIEHDGEVYIFNQNYKKGGSLPSSRSLGVSIEKIEIDIPDFRPEKLKEQTKTNKKPKTMAKKSAGSNKNKERMTLIQSVAKKIWAEGKCEKYSEAVSLASKKLKKEGKL